VPTKAALAGNDPEVASRKWESKWASFPNSQGNLSKSTSLAFDVEATK